MTDRIPGVDSGYGIRVSNVVEGLRSAGDLHVLLVDSSDLGVDFDGGAGFTGERVRASNMPRWMRIGRFPRLIPTNVRYRASDELRAAVADRVGSQPWDVIWCSRARVHLVTEDLVAGPRIVDFDDLSDRLLLSKITDRRRRRGHLLTVGLNVRDRLDAAFWGRLQRRIAERVETVVVCSEADRSWLGVDNCAVAPNGYPDPRRGAATVDVDVDRRPRMLFVGPLTYEPNRLAVEWLVEEVMPTVRAAVPDVELVVVGDDRTRRPGPAATGAVFTGHVPDVAPYYAAATVAVAPLHSGGGTRIKVIEALARSVPVVATTFGSAGHGLEPGLDLLVADDPDSFSAACVALLTDPERRDRLAAQGRATYESLLTARAATAAVASIAREAAGVEP